MTDLDHRVGVQEANLVVRHLKLENITDEKQQAIVAEIDQTFGVDNVSYDKQSQTINLAYDATRCNLEGLEEIISKHGADVAHDLWTHFKESYYRFVDENVKDNSKTVSHCCSKPPAGANRKK